jgi:hypothetical protein
MPEGNAVATSWRTFAHMQRIQSEWWVPDFVESIESRGMALPWQYHNYAGLKEENVEKNEGLVSP